MKRLAGVVLILFGLGLGSWVVYITFINDNPDDDIRRVGRAIGLAFAAVSVGFYWTKGSMQVDATDEATGPPAIEPEV